MNNKKIIIVLFLTILTVVILLFNFYGANKSYSYIQGDNSISVMVFNNTANNYIRQSGIPTGNYMLDENLSYCEGTGEIVNYDSTLGKVQTLIDGQDRCYFYFEPYISVTFTGTSYNDYNTYCQPQYSTDGGTTYTNIDIPSKSGTIKLPSGSIIRNVASNSVTTSFYECVISFCSSSSCTANGDTNNVKDYYIKSNNTHTYKTYTITGNETYYATFAGTCFAEETLIEVWDRKKKKKSKKKIKDIKIGDVVYTYDYLSGKVITSQVKGITINKTREVYHLVFDDDELLTTADHPFCVNGAGYLNASMLKKGYELIDSTGQSHILKDIFVESLDYDKEMYCLELEDGNSLLVGKNGFVALAAGASVLLVMGLTIKPMTVLAFVY